MLGSSAVRRSGDINAVAGVLNVIASFAIAKTGNGDKTVKPLLFVLCLQITSDAGGGTEVLNAISGILEKVILQHTDITEVLVDSLAKALPLASTQQLASTSPEFLHLNYNPFSDEGFHRLMVGIVVPITVLSVGGCEFVTTVPTEIGKLKSSEELWLSGTCLIYAPKRLRD